LGLAAALILKHTSVAAAIRADPNHKAAQSLISAHITFGIERKSYIEKQEKLFHTNCMWKNPPSLMHAAITVSSLAFTHTARKDVDCC